MYNNVSDYARRKNKRIILSGLLQFPQHHTTSHNILLITQLIHVNTQYTQ